MNYLYWNNKQKWHGELIADIEAASIEEADEKFKKINNISPISAPYIGVQIFNLTNQKSVV